MENDLDLTKKKFLMLILISSSYYNTNFAKHGRKLLVIYISCLFLSKWTQNIVSSYIFFKQKEIKIKENRVQSIVFRYLALEILILVLSLQPISMIFEKTSSIDIWQHLRTRLNIFKDFILKDLDIAGQQLRMEKTYHMNPLQTFS